MSSFPLEVQEAFFLHRMLSDRWDGMSGYYQGKDMTALSTYIKVYEITDPCLLYTSPSPRDRQKSRMPSSA